MFSGCSKLTSLDLSTFDTNKVTNMSSMFYGCSKLTNIDLSRFNTSKVTNMSSMFYGCSTITSLDLSTFDTSQVTSMSSMFSNCSNLKKIIVGNNYNTDKVTSSNYMFSGDSKLVGSNGTVYNSSYVDKTYARVDGGSSNPGYFSSPPVTSKFLTGQEVNEKMKYLSGQINASYGTTNTAIKYIKYSNKRLTEYSEENIVSTEDSNYPIYMWYDNKTIYYYSQANTIYLNEDSSYMFSNLTNLERIEIVFDFDSSLILNSDYMFKDCTNIVGDEGTEYNSSYMDSTYAHFDGGLSNPGYFSRSTYSIIYNSNGGEGNMPNQVVPSSLQTYLTINNYTKSGYTFAGWNTRPDGTGISYLDNSLIQGIANPGKTITLYAQWITTSSTLMSGSNLNSKMKSLSGQTGNNTVITSIQRTNIKPDSSKMTSNNKVSSYDSLTPIYMWYDNGTIYWWSEAETVYLNYSSSSMFENMKGLTSFVSTEYDSSRTGYMDKLFYGCTNLETVDLSDFDTSNVANMSQMFTGCTSLETIDFGNINVSNVRYMMNMFYNCTSLETIDLSNWNTSKLTDISYMFYNCSSLTSVDLSSFDTSNITNISNILSGCTNLEYANISNMRIIKSNSGFGVNNYFRNCNNLKTIIARNIKFVGESATSDIFRDLTSLETIDLTNVDTSEATTFSYMFYNCLSLESIDLSSFDTSNVTNMSSMFSGCRSLSNINFGNINTGKVTNMSSMFSGCRTLSNINLSNLDLKNVTSIGSMFENCTSLETIDLNIFSDSKITSMSYLVSGCTNLINIYIDNVDTSRIKSMYGMFKNCTSLVELHLNTFDTSNTTDMSSMFQGCTNLQKIFVSSFDTSNVKSMSYMFEGCSSLEVLDISSFSSTKLSSFSGWFNNCTSLRTIYANSSFRLNGSTNIFTNCTNLVGGAGTVYSTSYNQSRYAHVDGGTNDPGLFTDGSLSAKFIQGKEVNQRMKTLAGQENPTYNTVDQNITKISFSNKKPQNLSDINIVSTSDSYYPIYMWYKDNTIYYYSPTKSVYYNDDCSYMFAYLTELTNISLEIDFKIGTISSSTNMFIDDINLVGGAGTVYNSSHVDISYAHEDKGSTNPGYYTSNLLTVQFDANGGTGAMGVQIIQTNSATILSKNIFTKDNYVFSSWNTEPDGSGDSYSDEGLILTSSSIKLYAQWDKAKAKFNTGQIVNEKIKKLVNSNTTYLDTVSNINAIERSLTKPSSSNMAERNIVSISDSTYNTSIYMWYSSGTIYYWSEDSSPSFNEDCSYMFYNLISVKTIDLSSVESDLVTNTSSMFKDDANLLLIYSSESFNNNTVTNSTEMFSGATNLVGGLSTVYDSNHLDKNYAHLDGGSSNPGYFSTKGALNIIYNSNGGTGSMANQQFDYNTIVTLTTNSFTKTNYLFTKWCTKADGSGICYSDGASAIFTTSVTLYANWVEKKATFLPGQTLNARIKKIAGNTNTGLDDSDTNIKYIQKSSTAPNISSMTSDNIVSASGSSTVPIYMWLSNGTLYWWSEDSNPKLIDADNLFSGLQGLKTADLRSINTEDLTDMSHMFENCTSLTSVNTSGWNTSNVIEMDSVFYNCSSLTSINLNHFNTSKVTTMSNMFGFCSNLSSITINKFNTSNVTNMSAMFQRNNKLTSLDISSFDTSKVTNMSWMFSMDYVLKTIYVSNSFTTSNVTSSTDMFHFDDSIIGGNGTRYNSSYEDKTYARIDRAGTPGYFTYKAAPSANITRFINAFNANNSKAGKFMLLADIIVLIIAGSAVGVFKYKQRKKIRF